MRFIGDLCSEDEHGGCQRADCECSCHLDDEVYATAKAENDFAADLGPEC